MKTLSKNNDLIIQKSDKGNSTALINKIDYLYKMYNILSDSKKNAKVDHKHLNFIISIDKKLTDSYKELKASKTISEIDYKKFKPRGFSFDALDGLCETHK